ncbi:hypothetical protein MM1218R_01460 [Mycobacterium marinum]|uniref:BRO-N domain-containing protein n=1 Tax=Mycobacterium marinum TaxID=1781 RepID=UPI000E28F3E1|nr:Bro-N domain-containing protein [Mycobacterium marinum]AXN43408.1 hypothetical protein MM1218R_01460 [Mycobacterium marinum]RFZ11539.1 hypothetical protein DE4381_01127 [Mycobacterium marinum]
MSDLLFKNPEFDLPIQVVGDTFQIYGPALAGYLGFHGAAEMVRYLDADEKLLVTTPVSRRTGVIDANTWYVTEPGFYRIVNSRVASRIKDPTVRETVVRFQRWVNHDVLPAIRKHGQYSVDQFTTWDRDEVCAQVRQAYGFDFNPATLGRALRDAGVIKQNGAPKVKFKHLFHHTGTAWNLHPFALRQVVIAVLDARQAIEAAKSQMSMFEVES